LSGKRREAESAVPEDLLRALSLIGTRAHVKERLEVYRSAGVSTINVRPMAPDPRRQLDDVAALRELLG
jgi:alkanesulfonate monooxygenase SsuD/methylene tetrahydromethanopterin reductase-like flavin-dependent oxidoreductase (luciferase family)